MTTNINKNKEAATASFCIACYNISMNRLLQHQITGPIFVVLGIGLIALGFFMYNQVQKIGYDMGRNQALVSSELSNQ